MRLVPVVLALCSLSAATLAAQQTTFPLWPKGTPEPAHTTGPERDSNKPTDRQVAGRPMIRLTDVSNPTLAFFPAPTATNTGAAVLVFPGGAYTILAYDLEGTEVCTWLNSAGVNCVLVKYRVPEQGHFPANTEDLEDAQQAMRLTRSHAADWKLDPSRIGVLGFSAGAHLVVSLSTHPDFAKPGPALSELAAISARPNFVFVIYPGYLNATGDLDKLDPALTPPANTPPTFLLQAEDDPVHVENCLVYYKALKNAGVKAELHLYAEAGHGFGLRPIALPATHWPELGTTWMRTLGVIPAAAK